MNGPEGEARLERLRLLSMAVALCFLFLVVTALVTILRDPYQMDFISYWAAGKLGLHGQAPLAYDVVAHHRIELEATAVGQIPFGYPPAFLLVAAPFALLPYPQAAALWVILTWAAYAAAVRFWAPKAFWLAMAMPPLLINAITGQAGFLLAALFIAGMALLPKRPLLGGLLLVALVLPVAHRAGSPGDHRSCRGHPEQWRSTSSHQHPIDLLAPPPIRLEPLRAARAPRSGPPGPRRG